MTAYHELVDRITSKTEGGVVATERPAAVSNDPNQGAHHGHHDTSKPF